VFIHEFGHFWIARLCGVRVEAFSIGFGLELFGFNDKKGTRWKFCLLPFGGYVKMFGDRNAASAPDAELIAIMSAEDKKHSFVGKNVYQRMAIVVAGPVANIILTIFLLTVLFRVNGLNEVAPVVESTIVNSAAAAHGLQKNDRILAIDGVAIKTFDDVRLAVTAPGKDELLFKIQRNDEIIEISIAPKIETRPDFFGDNVKVRTLGVVASKVHHEDLDLLQSFAAATKETGHVAVLTFKALGELIIGKRDLSELSGPVKIAKYSGKSVDMGWLTVLWFAAMISLNLGVLNLLPIPVLDGGHLFFYIFEAILGKPLPQRIQQVGFQFGMLVVLSLMVFSTYNDIRQLIGF
jgi:regulator of sigma E protease